MIHSLPLGFDRHTHVSLYAALGGCPSLAGLGRGEALALLKGLPQDRLNVVPGWHSGRLPFAAAELDALPPLLLVNFSLHGFRLNPSGERLLRELEPGVVERSGDPAWCERNLPRLLSLYGRLARLDASKLAAFLAQLEALGIGAAEDMLLMDAEAWRVMRYAGPCRFWASPELFLALPLEAQREAQGLKLFADGAIGARTAALSEPYLDGRPGMLLWESEAFLEELARLHPLGKALAIHAIGDLAIERVIQCLERAAGEGLAFTGIRIEHAQFITESQARRARDLGLTLSMQPNFSSDSVDYADRLGESWREANNPFRMLIDRVGFQPGKDLLFGSDGMPHGLEYALQWSLFPAFEGQRLSLDELRAGYGIPEGEGPFRVEIDQARRTVRTCRTESHRKNAENAENAEKDWKHQDACPISLRSSCSSR